VIPPATTAMMTTTVQISRLPRVFMASQSTTKVLFT
jgi:hypothetical protein